ncbi:NAD(P)H-binding protein [Fragilaria crotonensis]|nr:NAD(P)H-binding protein [Fragilaria crotonensis]
MSFATMPSNNNVVLFGANGDIGKRVLLGLLEQGINVKAVVRSKHKLDDVPKSVTIVEASIMDMDHVKLQALVLDCQIIISCLSHGKQIFREPKRILLDSTTKILNAMSSNHKLIILNGAGARHPAGREATGWLEWIIVSLLRIFVPPHADMEETLQYLQEDDQHNWIAMRPGMFADQTNSKGYTMSEYRTVGLFSGRVATKANVADAIVRIATSDELQETWNRKMPVVLDDE